ncbi:MAG: biotin--[acetyl-CoA-carboxylase] ligase [Planctomycetota bacterium]|jgi:BirA family biotin operon repressor/biotin-[acetyl-CoA-carboxylase] ligase
MMQFDRLDADVIKADLHTAWIGKEIIVFKSTASTNDIAWEYAANRKNNGLCIFAEQQTAGRGRRANKWLGGSGDSILCSILLLDWTYSIELLTLASAVATAKAIKEHCCLDARLKWPNDIMIKGKKAAGILLESGTDTGRSDYVIGVGINCHQRQEYFQDSKFRMPATSIDIQSKATADRNSLAANLLASFDEWLTVAKIDSDRITDTWCRLSSQIGHHVIVEYNRQRFGGNCIGVDPVRGLILQLDDGGVRMFDAAHTTIVKHL